MSADFVEIVMGPESGGEVTLHLAGEMPRSLPALRTLTNVLQMSTKGPMQFQISSIGRPTFSFSVPIPIDRNSQDLEQLSNVISCLEAVSVGVLPTDLTLSLDQIDAAWNALVEFNGLITGTNLRGTFTLERAPEGVIGPATAVYLYGYLDIGDWTFLAVVRRSIIQFEFSGVSASFECGDPRVAEAIIRKGSGKEHVAEIHKLYRDCVELEGQGVIEFFGGDYGQLISNPHEGPVVFRNH